MSSGDAQISADADGKSTTSDKLDQLVVFPQMSSMTLVSPEPTVLRLLKPIQNQLHYELAQQKTVVAVHQLEWKTQG